mgnify:CR=1 FL=1
MGQYTLALRSFHEYLKRERKLYQHWEIMNTTREAKTFRPPIESSWQRCLSQNIDPMTQEAPIVYTRYELKGQQEKHRELLQLVYPYMQELYEQLAEENILIMLSDADGIILDGKATSKAWSKVQKHHFIPGADWSEAGAGTNAIGTAIAEKKPVQVFGAEHFCQGWHSWVCSAAPIIDPVTNVLLGVLDISGIKDRVQAHGLPLVISQVQKIQRELGNRVMNRELSFLQGIVDILQEPVFIFDSYLRIVRCNEKAGYILRLSPGDSLKKFLDIPNADIERFPFWGQTFPLKVTKDENNPMWTATLHPYRLDQRIIGGVAVLKRITYHSRGTVQRTLYTFDQIVTRSPVIQQLIEEAKMAAVTDKTLLITGETGTGKEVFAQSVHAYSFRSGKKFVEVNCGALPKELIASELFGYTPGAFTGALSKGKQGKFVAADGGTLFLDEIGELPLEAQASLLRVLEEKAVVPLGSIDPIPVDVRIIAATNRDLAEEVRMGRFREDLYYRLHVLTIHIPPLRERKEDIPLLVEHFLHRCGGGKGWTVEGSAMDILLQYDWPGNVRQLKHVLEQAMFRAKGGIITPHDLPPLLQTKFRTVPSSSTHPQSFPFLSPSKRPRPALTRELLERTLKQVDDNVAETARLLNVSRMTVYRKMKEFGIKRS